MTRNCSSVGLLPVVIRGFAGKTIDMLVDNGLYTNRLPLLNSSPTVLSDRPKVLVVPVLGLGVVGVNTGS
jgi:hypothetical protein